MQQKKKKTTTKKVFCRPVAIVKIEGLHLSHIWAAEREARHETEPGLCGSFIGAYLLVCYSFCSVTLVDSCPLFCWKATDRLHYYCFYFVCFFLEMKHKTKSNNGILVKVKRTYASIKKKRKKKKPPTNFTKWSLLCYSSNSGIEQCCLVLF